MRVLSLTMVTDGSSDQCLQPIVDWIIGQHNPNLKYRIELARRGIVPVRDGLRARLLDAIRRFPCDVLFVHRDSEAMPYEERIAEIAAETQGVLARCVPVVPVRMTEAWLLSDEAAIRKAANNPRGVEPLDLFDSDQWELLPDPKETLFQALRAATDLGARRRAKFNVHRARIRVPQLTADFARLRVLDSFARFENATRLALDLVQNG